MMKLAVVTAFPRDPDRPSGGVEAVSVNLVRALCALPDLCVHVVTTDRSAERIEESGWQTATVHRLPHSRWPTLIDAIGPGGRSVRDFLVRLAPDVVHAHDVYGLMVRDLPMPRVFTIHGFIHVDTGLSGKRLARLRAWFWQRAETAGWARQPHIVSISPAVRERLSGKVTGTIHDIDNPIAPDFYSIDRREVSGTIFSAGMLTRHKNPLALVEALALIRATGVEARLRLAGPPKDAHYVARLKQRIAELDLGEHVALLGALSSEQVRAELSRASVFALVSFAEGAPMVIAEAMAAGLPIVTSNCSGMPHMVRDGETGLLASPHDVGDIANQLRTLLLSAGQRAAMGGRARDIARERFHPASVAVRTRAVYQLALRRG